MDKIEFVVLIDTCRKYTIENSTKAITPNYFYNFLMDIIYPEFDSDTINMIFDFIKSGSIKVYDKIKNIKMSISDSATLYNYIME